MTINETNSVLFCYNGYYCGGFGLCLLNKLCLNIICDALIF